MMRVHNNEKLPIGIMRLLEGLSIREWTRRRVNILLERIHYKNNQVFLNEILEYRNISKRPIYDITGSTRGMLRIINDTFYLSLNKKYRLPKYIQEKRFTIAHEMGHTYFFDINGEIIRRYPWVERRTREEEYICDTFASELLMPCKTISKNYKQIYINNSPDVFIDTLLALSSKYCVTYFTLAVRIIRELELWNGILICCAKIGKIIGEKEDALRIIWAIYPKYIKKPLYIPKPLTKMGPFMKLRWNSIEDKFDQQISHVVQKITLDIKEINKLSNIKIVDKENKLKYRDIGMVKINRHPFEIPFEGIETDNKGLDNILLIAYPLNQEWE
jgi:hypothetical protein